MFKAKGCGGVDGIARGVAVGLEEEWGGGGHCGSQGRKWILAWKRRCPHRTR